MTVLVEIGIHTEGECSVFLSAVRAAVIMMVLYQPMLGVVVEVGVVAGAGVTVGDMVNDVVRLVARDEGVVEHLHQLEMKQDSRSSVTLTQLQCQFPALLHLLHLALCDCFATWHSPSADDICNKYLSG